jgi:hypothetical protein
LEKSYLFPNLKCFHSDNENAALEQDERTIKRVILFDPRNPVEPGSVKVTSRLFVHF